MKLPSLPRGRPSSSALSMYDAELEAFCTQILEINSRLDFPVSSRGWCYILEEHGLSKGDFNAAQEVIATCRQRRLLPMDIVAQDEARSFENLEDIDEEDPEEFAEGLISSLDRQSNYYTPISFWDDKDTYIEMVVEKIDLKSLFAPICTRYRIPIANARGWSDLNLRWGMLQRLREHTNAGRECVILYCGDHDPAGLNISGSLRKNLSELLTQAEWLELMDRLVIDRFGLNADFIAANNLTWVDNLETSSGKSLADPRHKDHTCDYVQRYIRQFGARKVEANALVVRPEAGRQLCLEAILKYLPEDAPEKYQQILAPYRERAHLELLQQLQQHYSGNAA
jgi:hypothetical protein